MKFSIQSMGIKKKNENFMKTRLIFRTGKPCLENEGEITFDLLILRG